MRISDWSSDVCSSDLRTKAFCSRPDAARSWVSSDLMVWIVAAAFAGTVTRDNSHTSVWLKRMPPVSMKLYSIGRTPMLTPRTRLAFMLCHASSMRSRNVPSSAMRGSVASNVTPSFVGASNLTAPTGASRLEAHTSELPSLMRISYAVLCLKNQPQTTTETKDITSQDQTTHT